MNLANSKREGVEVFGNCRNHAISKRKRRHAGAALLENAEILQLLKEKRLSFLVNVKNVQLLKEKRLSFLVNAEILQLLKEKRLSLLVNVKNLQLLKKSNFSFWKMHESCIS